jgi:excisionase family DNA binding protein
VIERHYKTAELAGLLGLHPETVRRAAAAGKLESVRVGQDRIYAESAVQAWLDSNRETPRVVALTRRRMPDRTR